MDVEEEQQQQQKRYQIVLSGVGRMIKKPKIVLPEEIIHYEILSRLPAKYLVRLRSVCRCWKSLNSNSEFVKLHRTRQNWCKDQDLLIGQRYIAYGFGHGVSIFSRSKEISVTVGPSCSDILLGSINGLVCMASKEGFCLWNPAFGKLKEVGLPISQHSKACTHIVGFSWDHVGNDYKVVMMCYSPKKLCVYSSNSASWTEGPISDSLLPDRGIFGPSVRIAPSTIVKGTPYWSVITCSTLWYGQHRHKYISVFKFLAENNELRLLPYLSSVGISGKKFDLVNIKDRLSGMVYEIERQGSMVDIYSLDEESHDGVWSKTLTIGPIYLQKKSLLLNSFKNGGEILISDRGTFSLYDPKTKQTKSVDNNPCHIFRRFYSYTPSLVCVQGMESDAALFISGKGHKLQPVG